MRGIMIITTTTPCLIYKKDISFTAKYYLANKVTVCDSILQ